MALRRYPWAPGGLCGLHDHIPHHYLDHPHNRGALWTRDLWQVDRCCEFCDIWDAIPNVDTILEDLSLWDPLRHARILEMYHGIHGHYKMGYDHDGPESYYLSREVDKLSGMLQKLYRHGLWSGRGLGDLATQLKYMGRDTQIGRRRRRYHVHPHPRYRDGRYYLGGRGYW